jgi:hypothetical protein
MKLIKIAFIWGLLVSNSAFGQEIWVWNTNIGRVQTFGGHNSAYACFTADRIDRKVCFDLTETGAKEKFSMLLSARAANITVSLSYLVDQSISALWFENYLAWHIWIED